MTNKQSSVEWFAEQTLNALITKEKYDELLQKAKSKQKEEHRKTYNQGLMSNFQNFDDYYNETFEGGKK